MKALYTRRSIAHGVRQSHSGVKEADSEKLQGEGADFLDKAHVFPTTTYVPLFITGYVLTQSKRGLQIADTQTRRSRVGPLRQERRKLTLVLILDPRHPDRVLAHFGMFEFLSVDGPPRQPFTPPIERVKVPICESTVVLWLEGSDALLTTRHVMPRVE